ncbi:MAG: translation initiation factor IF-2, partial [Defluviitaleaceae bacterium]|nr:translation initiation factor IF-2 [Defluviitaleaceae bacterium]
EGQGTGYSGDRPRRPEGQGTGYSGDRPRRPEGQGTGYSGDRPRRPEGQGTGYSGDRPRRPEGQGTGYSGDRPRRPEGQGTGYGGDRPRRPEGQGTGYSGDRPRRPEGQGTGYGGDRPRRPEGQGTGFGAARRPDAAAASRPDSRTPRGKGKPGEQGAKPGAGKPGMGGKPDSKPASRGRGKDTRGDAKPYRKQDQATVSQLISASTKKKKKRIAKVDEIAAMEQVAVLEADEMVVRLPKSVSVKDLAGLLDKTTAEIIKKLMKVGIMANINQEVDYYTASKIAEDFDLIAEKLDEEDVLEMAFASDVDDPEDLVERSPVVVVMGHVDHGKTSLLDRIRNSSVVTGEAGGITQHIGAYTVAINNKTISFLDTPGHEAFTAMRMRGAQVTDIAILVVAADDGVMPQTIEAINHAKAAGVDIIVAINKIDRVSANPDRVKQELTEYGLVAEEWGGSTICVPVSAINGTGIDTLLEMITLTAEMKELRANPKGRARGTVIEAQLDKGRGPVATVLVQNGTLNVGDPVVVGATFGKIRAMVDDKGKKVKTAGPSTPVEVLGLSGVPSAGDAFYAADNEKQARQYAESVTAKSREDMIKQTPNKVSLNDLFNQIKEGSVKDLNIVVKADVQGSVEAVKNSLERLSNDEVRIRTIHGGVGAVTETDVMLASTSNAIIIGFNVRPDAPARAVADAEKVDIRLYRIIYQAIEDITAAMKGLLEPVYAEKIVGNAEIRQIFKASGIGNIAGCYVTNGKIMRSAQIRVVRDGIVVYDGTLSSFKRFQDDVREVASNFECAMTFNKFGDIREGDKVEAYIMEEIPR